jgi:Domain of unknown function (DUF4277)
MASVIKDLGLIDMINARLGPDAPEVMTPGAAVAGMILNGLGFANRPMSLTPQLVANKPLDLWGRDGLRADRFNRFTLGRIRDEAYADGCDLVWQERALAGCAQEGIDLRVNHLDTTRCALSGDYVPDGDEHALRLTHGYSKDHRPDLKQAVLERMVSQDGGVPFVSTSWDGHTSDTQMFQERAQAFMSALKTSPRPRYLLADAKLSTEDHAANRHRLGFSTRLANTIGVVAHVLEPALTWDPWHTFAETTRDQGVELCHDGMAQRWLVGSSQAALERAEATVHTSRFAHFLEVLCSLRRIRMDTHHPHRTRPHLQCLAPEQRSERHYPPRPLQDHLCPWLPLHVDGSMWKCGCRDEVCTQNYWQLQGIQQTTGSRAVNMSQLITADLRPPPPPPPPSPSLAMTLSLNQTAFRTSDSLRVALGARNPNPAFTADFYFGVLLPDGVSALFVTSLSPLNGVVSRLDASARTLRTFLANVQLPQGLDTTLTDFLVYTFAGGETAGTYSVFAALTPSGAFDDGRIDAGDLLVLDIRPFVFTP